MKGKQAANEVRVGWWATTCCHLDLEQLKSEDDIKNARAELLDPEHECPPEVWPTRREALTEIRQSHWLDKNDLAEIDAMLTNSC